MIYRFDKFELDLDRFELRLAGEPIKVEPQVFQLIAFMASRPERLITRDEIIENVWAGRIVSEAALSSRIKSARRALGDDGRSQRFIRTVHSQGFRFDVSVVASEAERHKQGHPLRGTDLEVKGSDPPSLPDPISQGADRPSVAVLPFCNLSGSPEQDYFADGMTTDIIALLSKHRWLGVVSRNTSFGYKNKLIDVRELAQQLGIAYVVEGTVQRADTRVRITAQLISSADASHIWSDRYDRELADIFAVQDEITQKIVARLEPAIGHAERERIWRSPRRDLHAWDCYHLGMAHFFKFTAEDNLEAQRLLQLSRKLDPSFGEAHAWWAYATVLGMVYWDTELSRDALDSALEAANTALRLDSQNAVFYMLKARVQLARGEYQSALAENKIAIALNGTFAAAHCGLGDSLAYEGEYEQALASFEQAIALSPNDPQRWAFLTYGALALIFKGDYEEAVRWADEARELPNCQYWTIAHKAVALAHLGRQEDAQRVVMDLIAEKPNFSVRFAQGKLFYLKRPDQLRLYLDGLRQAGVPLE